MQEAPSPTSSAPSERWSRSNVALAVWLAISGLLIAVAFLSSASGSGDEGGDDVLFRYEFAIGSVVVYGAIVALTWFAARSFERPREALGLRSFSVRWVWVALGLTFVSLVLSAALEPVLHAGEEQGLAPDRWERDRATAFAVNAVVVTLVVPFAEELFFRGLGVRALGFLGGTVAVGATAIVFALAHGLLSALLPLGFFAAALGWVRYRSESVWPGFLAHAAYNGVGVLVAAYFALDSAETRGLLGLF
jgi:uncharacterized protein